MKMKGKKGEDKKERKGQREDQKYRHKEKKGEDKKEKKGQREDL